MPQKDTKGLFDDAPPRDLAFPPEELLLADEERLAIPITLCEIFAFLVNWYRTYPVAFRCASNGLTTQLAKQMIHYYRVAGHKGEVGNSTLCKIIGNAMGACGLHMYPEVTKSGDTKDEPWSLTRHANNNTKNYWGPWDHRKLTLTGFRHDGNSSSSEDENVSFASLAEGVQRFPSVQHGDGSNLTRCVQYAVAHPLEDLQFPRDLKSLTYRLGRLPVVAENYDLALVDRWRTRKGAPNPPDRVIIQQPQALLALPVNPPITTGSSSSFVQSATAGPSGAPHSSRTRRTRRARRTRCTQGLHTSAQSHTVAPPPQQQQQSDGSRNDNSTADATQTLTSGLGQFSAYMPYPTVPVSSQPFNTGIPSSIPPFPMASQLQHTASASIISGLSNSTHLATMRGRQVRHTVPTTNGMVTPVVQKRKQDTADDVFELRTKKQRYDNVPAVDDFDPSMAPWWAPSPAASPFGATLAPPPHYQASIATIHNLSTVSQPLSAVTTADDRTETWAQQSNQFAGYESIDMWTDSLVSKPTTNTGTFLPSMAGPESGDDLFVPIPPGPVDPALTHYSLDPGFQATINNSYNGMTLLEPNPAADNIEDFMADNTGSKSFDTQDPTFAPTEDLDTFLARFFAQDVSDSSSTGLRPQYSADSNQPEEPVDDRSTPLNSSLPDDKFAAPSAELEDFDMNNMFKFDKYYT
jgi:hypothetical protein